MLNQIKSNIDGVSVTSHPRLKSRSALRLITKSPSLSTNDRSQAFGMLRAGQSSRQFATVFGVAQSTMSRLLQRFNTTQLVNDRRRCTRPRVTTRQEDNTGLLPIFNSIAYASAVEAIKRLQRYMYTPWVLGKACMKENNVYKFGQKSSSFEKDSQNLRFS